MNKIINGDSTEVLKTLEVDSIDLVVTDPPYGYSFMGKDWDKAVPSVEIWKECLRVLKPGAFCFVMSAPRQDVLSQMIVRLGEAGFKIDFTSLYWTYASGFPKAMNIGKMVDKRAELNIDVTTDKEELGKWLKEKRGARTQKNIAKNFLSKTGGLTGCVSNWEKGTNLPTWDIWTKLKEILTLDSRYDHLIENRPNNFTEAEREVVGKNPNGFGRNTGSSLTHNLGAHPDLTAPSTDQAKALDGSYGGFQPKPAVEVIIVCMKPLSEKTYVDQAIKNGKGITWLDNARIPSQKGEYDIRHYTDEDCFINDKPKKSNFSIKPQPLGRFPANLLVSDDILNNGKVSKSTIDRNPIIRGTSKSLFTGDHVDRIQRGDSGGFSRFFSLDKWAEQLPFLVVAKASKREKNKGLDGFEDKVKYSDFGLAKRIEDGEETNERTNKEAISTKNHHPTVKPLKLMSYLITLGSQKGDVVLDPFCGSGTTCLAAKELGRNYIGIEREGEYVEIANARLNQLSIAKQGTLI